MGGSGGSGNGGMQGAPPPPSSSSSSIRPFPSDSEEFSALFNQLLMDPNHPGSDYPPTIENRVASSSTTGSSGFSFSDDPFANVYVPDSVVPLTNYSDANASHNNLTCPLEKSGEPSELASRSAPPPRTSSKRSRAAEFHNLSEKRRRSRINEKMKALQNLIPNSNKTDKASMLDEAIEYLKQLQLQVQMLMMRNGYSLHPMSLPGGIRPMVLPQGGLNFDDEGTNGFQNSTGGIDSSANDLSLVRPGYTSFPKHCSFSNESVAVPSATTPDTSSSFHPYIKDALCGNMPQLLLDATKTGQTPSPDVS